MAMDLLTTHGINKYFSNLFKSTPEDIGIADITTSPNIPVGEVHITISKGRKITKIKEPDLGFIKDHKDMRVKMIIIRRISIFGKSIRLWQQEV